MKAVRLMAVAAMLSLVFPLASLASAKTSREQKQKVSVMDKVEIAGKTLQPGSYQVEWQGNGPMVNVKFMQYGKTLLTTPAHVAQLKAPAPYSAVVETTHKNGAKTIQEIEWNHKREALKFGSQPAMGAMHHSRRSS